MPLIIMGVVVGSHVVDEYADKIIEVCKKNGIYCCEMGVSKGQLEYRDGYFWAVG